MELPVADWPQSLCACEWFKLEIRCVFPEGLPVVSMFTSSKCSLKWVFRLHPGDWAEAPLVRLNLSTRTVTWWEHLMGLCANSPRTNSGLPSAAEAKLRKACNYLREPSWVLKLPFFMDLLTWQSVSANPISWDFCALNDARAAAWVMCLPRLFAFKPEFKRKMTSWSRSVRNESLWRLIFLCFVPRRDRCESDELAFS